MLNFFQLNYLIFLGIHYTGKISYLDLKCKESISDPTVKNEGDICFFIKNNIDIFKNIHTGEGKCIKLKKFYWCIINN